MPALKELILEFDQPTALGRRFFIGLLPRSHIRWPYKWASEREEQLQACPSLEVLGLKYGRWFRPGELNEMAALVALAHLDHNVKIWVEKSADNQERIQMDHTSISASILCSLGLLQLVNGEQPPTFVVKETIQASLATSNPTSIEIHHPETMIHFSPSIYSSLFQWLKGFALHVDVDQRVLFEALTHFEHLKELYVESLSPSPCPCLLLLRTLKTLHLGKTSLSWMEGCIFMKLEDLEIGNIEGGGGHQLQCVQMPMCKSASFPQTISSRLLRAFKMPLLRSLELHGSPVGLAGGFHYPSTHQFRLHSLSLFFVGSAALRDALAMQPELEVLEIRGLIFPWKLGRGLSDVLDTLLEPHNMRDFNSPDHNDSATGLPRQELPLCPKLKELKLKLTMEWKSVKLQNRVLELKQNLEHMWKWKRMWRIVWDTKLTLNKLLVVLVLVVVLSGLVGGALPFLGLALVPVLILVLVPILMLLQRRKWKRELLLVQKQEQKQKQNPECEQELAWEQKWKQTRQCQMLMRQRSGSGCPLQCCHLAIDSHHIRIDQHDDRILVI